MGSSIRSAGVADVVEVVDLVESAYRGERSRSGWTTEADLIDGQRVDDAMVRQAVSDPGVVVLVHEAADEIVACCEVRRCDGGGAEFGMFAVSPAQQGRGVGHRMLEAAEDRARTEWGAGTLQMSVIEQRVELIAWYRRRGYEPTGERRPFPYGDERFGRPRRSDLCFVVLAKRLVADGTSTSVGRNGDPAGGA